MKVEGNNECQCRALEMDGSIKHDGRLITFESREVDSRRPHTVIVCWHHRKGYSGWKKSKTMKQKGGEN